jgi:hypothetical protein
MPSFGSKSSPSLRKMELNGGGRFNNGGGKKFNIGNIAGDPFSLATLGISIVSAYGRETWRDWVR